MPTRILLADDHPVWRRGVRDVLSSEPDLLVVWEASDGTEALRALRSQPIDVAVLDMEMPGLTGVEVARAAVADSVTARILALSSYDAPAYVTGLLRTGAAGYLTKDRAPELIVEAVRAVARGEGRWFVTPPMADPGADLTPRERDVLDRLSRGLSNVQIAEALSVSENTVRSHLTSVYAKVGVASAREAIAWAWQSGFTGPEERAD